MSAASGVLDMPKKGKGRKVKPADESSTESGSEMLTVRCTTAWLSWLGELTAYDRSGNKADCVDRALVEYARKIGFAKMPPNRLG